VTLSDRLKRVARKVSRRGKDAKRSRARAEHFDKIADREHKKWVAAKKDGRQRNAARAKAKAQRATRKAAWWDEQADEAEAGYEEMKKRRERIKRAQAARRAQRSTTGGGFQTPARAWNPYRRQVCGWLIPILDEARSRGWRGVVVSGVRTPAYSISLCYRICNRPSCSGTCAGASSNHNATTCAKPQGALDLSDYYTFASIMRQMGNPIYNDLPNDRVHFSATGH